MSDALGDNLLEASYEGITFPVSDADSSTENGFVAHKAYRRPGADIEPTGREPYQGSLTMPLVNDTQLIQQYGTIFPDLLEQLRQKIIDKPIGNFTHPRFGVFTAFMQKLSEPLRATTRNGLFATLDFIEHNASVSDAIVFQGQTGQDTSVTANQQAAAADSAMAEVPAVAAVIAANAALPSGQVAAPVPFTPTAPVVATATATLETASQPLGTIQSAIASMVTVVQGNLAQPTLQTVDAYDAIVALETLLATVYQLQQKFLASKAKPGVFVVPVTMPLWEVAFQVYDDTSLASLIASANDIEDWTQVPIGTQLVIPVQPAA